MNKRRSRGMTLVEILVSVMIIAVGLLAVVQCLSFALITSLKAYRIDQATAIAETKIEYLRSTGQASIDTETVTEDLADPNIPNGQLSYTVTTYDATLNVHQVVVVVSWTGAGTRTESVQLETLVGDRAKYTGG